MNEWYLPAFCGLAISGATDWVSILVNASHDLSTYHFCPDLLLSSHSHVIVGWVPCEKDGY